MAGLRMVLLRHAFSMGNARREFSGTADVPLAPQGEQMVRDYRAQGVYEACALSERYFSSPLTRCLQTFHLALDGLATLDGTIDEFHEVEFGEMEGRVLERQQARAFFDAWVDGHARPAVEQDARAIVLHQVSRACARRARGTSPASGYRHLHRHHFAF